MGRWKGDFWGALRHIRGYYRSWPASIRWAWEASR